jgi:hypothetical protein
VAVTVGRPAPGELALRYTLMAEMASVRVPARSAPARVDGLWRHTCFEAFVKLPGESAYRELNFAPSGEWAAYRFSAYRAEMAPDLKQPPPRLEIRSSANALTLDAHVSLSTPLADAPAIALALTAVLESDDGTLSFWALRHPGAKPDFHHPDSFALELAR